MHELNTTFAEYVKYSQQGLALIGCGVFGTTTWFLKSMKECP